MTNESMPPSGESLPSSERALTKRRFIDFIERHLAKLSNESSRSTALYEVNPSAVITLLPVSGVEFISEVDDGLETHAITLHAPAEYKAATEENSGRWLSIIVSNENDFMLSTESPHIVPDEMIHATLDTITALEAAGHLSLQQPSPEN